VVQQLPQPMDENLIVNEEIYIKLKRLDFIFHSRNPIVYMDEIKDLWYKIFDVSLQMENINTLKIIFYDYLEKNQIAL